MSKKDKKNKVLAINFGGIGDEILFFPTLKTIKESFENTSITLVCEPRSKSCQHLTNLIDDVITCDIKGPSKYLDILKMLTKVWFRGYKVVVSSGSTKFVSILLFLTGIFKRYGYNSGMLSKLLLTKAVPLNQQQYAVKMYHDLTSGFAPEAKCTLPEIDIPAEHLRWANETIGDRDKWVVLIHPGVSKMSIQKNIFKFWSTDNWIQLISMLLESNRYKVVLAGGPDDSSVMQAIRAVIAQKNYNTENLIDLFGKTKNISQLAALIKMSDHMVCVDSAPMHIAVGTRTETVAIFGPTDEKKLLPSDDARFIALKNDKVECRPCLWDKRQVSCEKPDCLNVEPEEVYEQILKFSQQ